MKYLLSFVFVFLLLFLPSLGKAQTEATDSSLGLPGDNLNLYAVLKLFQECKTLEEFEQKLNTEDSSISNLDLNNDENIDYIQVNDNVKDDVHNITLTVSLTKDETQTVAVIIVTKNGDGQAQVQLVGDEDLYGKDYIVEPRYEDAVQGTPNPGYKGDKKQVVTETVTTNVVTYTQVYSWPIVQFVFVPTYRPWFSPWYWGSYPGWWHPWHPHPWHWYYGYHYHWNFWYQGWCHRSYHYRVSGWHGWYYNTGSWRRRSAVYYTNYSAGRYRTTYSQPKTMQQGVAQFAKMNPKVPISNKKIPQAKIPAFRPNVVRPSRPSSEGGNGSVTRPVPNKPSVTRPTIPSTKPETRPRPTQPTRPVVRPGRPETRPALPRPAPKPATKPTGRPVPQRRNG